MATTSRGYYYPVVGTSYRPHLDIKALADSLDADIAILAGRTSAKPLCMVTRTTEQSIPNAALTAITWDSEILDTHNIHSTSSNTSRITPNVAGWYRVNFAIQYASNATGRRAAALRQNNGTVLYGNIITATSAGNVGPSASRLLYFNGTTDYVEAIAYQDAGVSLSTAGSDSKVFEVEYVRP